MNGEAGMKTPVIESWMYANPEEIADQLIAKSREKAKQDAKRKEIARKHNARRIRALVKKAMEGK